MSAEVDFFRERVGNARSLAEVIGNAGGFFSTCWEDQNPNAVFKAADASIGVDLMMARMEFVIKRRLLEHLGSRGMSQEEATEIVQTFNVWDLV